MEPDVGQILERRADLTPNRVGWVDWDEGERFRYKELDERANRAVNYLREEHDIQKGDRVSVLALNGLQYSDLYFGLGKIGAILAPLNWRLAKPELEYILEDCEPKVVLYDEESSDFTKQLMDSYTRASWIHLKEYKEALESSSPSRPEPTEPVNKEDPHAILYTSGTTGRPKGAILPHRMILWNSVNTITSWGLNRNDVAPIITPQFHTGGLNTVLTAMYHLGGKSIVTKEFDPEDTLRLIERESATVVFMVPVMFRMMSETDLFPRTDLSSVRFLITGGAPASEVIKRTYRDRGLVFKEGYGLTEVGNNCFSQTEAESLQKEGSVGRPVMHGNARVVNEQGEEVAPNQIGELLLSGPHVFSGYWENPEATEEAFTEDWFHTGDLARKDEEGYFYIEGRKKDMIISGGENIYLAEVERAIKEHPKVADAALIGVPDEKWGEVGHAIVVTAEDVEVTEKELTKHCKNQLAGYKVPKAFEFAKSLPRNSYGKLQRDQVEDQFGKNFS
ncbi:long-chain fatty acid--CoA ligase [Candidatus Bipolaricaulota bacterium]|nr:long-chain fatty acid--CoA ligase [Candidatus Bipolaricaulota bacterium]MBS3792609.1 long-chain fatty acid--CoA ligase [Candidatus Bipolaricaulota bacterium]MBS3813594.1 long-chain fatty acid--CoA ligase [Candidatus Bipolaricaulota bacterium]